MLGPTIASQCLASHGDAPLQCGQFPLHHCQSSHLVLPEHVLSHLLRPTLATCKDLHVRSAARHAFDMYKCTAMRALAMSGSKLNISKHQPLPVVTGDPTVHTLMMY